MSTRRRPSPSMAVSVTALVLAVGGTAVAADAPARVSSLISGSRIKNRSISGAKIKKNTLGGKEINEAKLAIVPRAGAALRAETAGGADTAGRADSAALADNATRVGGIDPATLVTNGEVQRVAVRLGAGEAKVLATNGAVSLVAHCTTQAADDVIRVYATTTAANSFLGGATDLPGGATPATFLNPTTSEVDATILQRTQPTATGTPAVRSIIDNGFVLGADGAYLSIQGETSALGINALGTKCLFVGTVVSSKLP